MFRIIKKINRKLIFYFLLITAIAITCIYIDRSNVIVKQLKRNRYVSFLVLLYGTEKIFPGRLEVYSVLYDKQSNFLKILSINTDVVVFNKKEKAKSLKTLFNENVKKDLNMAVKNFYTDLYGLINFAAVHDFYINISFQALDVITNHNVKLKSILANNSFENKDLESLNRFDMIEHTLRLMPRTVVKIFKGYSYFNTNIPRLSLIYSIFKLKFLRPILMFCEMPVKYTKIRIESDRQNIEEFLNKVYHSNLFLQTNTIDMLVDIKNASKKSRMAEKAAWLLRANGFDVLDWGNSKTAYGKTLIKDCKGNFLQALKIAKVLKNGKIIVSYNNKAYAGMQVFVGEDCIIYDDLDSKKGKKNAKN